MPTVIRYRPDENSPWITLESSRGLEAVVDFVRAKFHPDIVPDLKEPAFRRAIEARDRKPTDKHR